MTFPGQICWRKKNQI